jgi:hypothetical protein
MILELYSSEVGICEIYINYLNEVSLYQLDFWKNYKQNFHFF